VNPIVSFSVLVDGITWNERIKLPFPQINYYKVHNSSNAYRYNSKYKLNSLADFIIRSEQHYYVSS
jgi:hypothetical protein